jgi:hypothetical protein
MLQGETDLYIVLSTAKKVAQFLTIDHEVISEKNISIDFPVIPRVVLLI